MHMQFSYKCKPNVSFGWDQQYREKKRQRKATQANSLYIVCLYFQFNYKLKPNSTEPEKKKKRIVCSASDFRCEWVDSNRIRVRYAISEASFDSSITTIYFHFVIEIRLQLFRVLSIPTNNKHSLASTRYSVSHTL